MTKDFIFYFFFTATLFVLYLIKFETVKNWRITLIIILLGLVCYFKGKLPKTKSIGIHYRQYLITT